MQVMLETFNNIKCLLLVDRVPVENSFTPLSSKNEYTMDMRITRLRPAWHIKWYTRQRCIYILVNKTVMFGSDITSTTALVYRLRLGETIVIICPSHKSTYQKYINYFGHEAI